MWHQKLDSKKKPNFLVAAVQDLQAHHSIQLPGMAWLHLLSSPLQLPRGINQKFGVVILQTETQLSCSQGGMQKKSCIRRGFQDQLHLPVLHSYKPKSLTTSSFFYFIFNIRRKKAYAVLLFLPIFRVFFFPSTYSPLLFPHTATLQTNYPKKEIERGLKKNNSNPGGHQLPKVQTG